MRIVVVAGVMALLAWPAQAQMGGGRQPPPNDRPGSPAAQSRADDKAYKAALERIPDPKEKYDPWGMARPADGTKKPK